MTTFGLVIPTLNARKDLKALLPSIQMQTRQPDRFLVIDSSSDDGTVEDLRAEGVEVEVISRAEFNHGGTRMKGARMISDTCDIVAFMTQDVILHHPDALEALMTVFEDEKVGSAYGRQIPHEGADPIESFSRSFSYGDTPLRRTNADIPEIGFRTAFCSNAFSAYRISALQEVGGFPEKTIFGEDALAVGELILQGYTHCYVAGAVARHSHSYTLLEEFRRYFDIGVMHVQNRRLIDNFGSPSGAGFAFMMGELKYLAHTAPWRMPEAMMRTGLKFSAYKLGRREDKISLAWKKRLSMHKRYWLAL